MVLMASIFRASDGIPLCASTDMDFQTKSLRDCHKYIKLLSKKLLSFPDRCTLSLHGYNIHFISALDQTFMALTEETYPTVLAFCFLSEIQREFLVSYEHEKVHAARRPYAFMQFDPVLQKMKQRYNSPRNLTTRVNLSDMSHELKLRPPYRVREADISPTNGSISHSSHTLTYRPAYHPDRPMGSVSWLGWLAVSLNVFCTLLSFIRGMAIISHGHFDAEDSGAYKYGFTFLLSCALMAFQIYLVFRSMRMRTTVAGLTWLAVCFSIIYVAHFRNTLQLVFHLAANTFITLIIYAPPHRHKLPNYTV